MFREKVYGVSVKIEATSGVDAVPTNNWPDALRLIGGPGDLTYGYLEPGNRDDVVTGVLGRVGRAIPAGANGQLRIRLEVRGFGSAYNGVDHVPEAHALLQMCGMGFTTVVTPGAESLTYSTLDIGLQTGTVYCYTGNKLVKLVGCVANVDLTAAAMGRGFMDFTVTGKVLSVTELALPAFTITDTIPPMFHSVATTIGAYSSAAASDPLVLRSVALHLGNTVSDRPSAGATDGLIGFIISDRVPRQDMVIEVPQLTSFDAYATSKLVGAALPLTTWQIGPSGAGGQYNRLKVFTGRWAIEAPGHGADKNIATWNLTGNLVQGTEATSGRELRLVYD